MFKFVVPDRVALKENTKYRGKVNADLGSELYEVQWDHHGIFRYLEQTLIFEREAIALEAKAIEDERLIASVDLKDK